MSGGGKGGGNQGPTDSAIRSAMVFPTLRDPVHRAIGDARKLYERGYEVPGMNRGTQEGYGQIGDWAREFSGKIDDPTDYASWLGRGKGVSDAPGQEYLEGVYKKGAPQHGWGALEDAVDLARGVTGNLDAIRETAAGDMLGGNPHLDRVLGDINRGTTDAYRQSIAGLEGTMSRAGGGGGSVESQLRARENEGLARELAGNEAKIRYGDYGQERGYQQQAQMAIPGLFQTDVGTKLQAGGALQDAAYRKLAAEMEAATGAGAGYRSDISQALSAAGLLPQLGQAGFLPGQQMMQAGEYKRALDERGQNQDWESFSRYMDALGGVKNLFGSGGGGVQQGPSRGQQALQTGLGIAGTAAMFFSDLRLKYGVALVGTRNGLPDYAWSYAPGGPRFRGPLAQDVARLAPELVRVVAGYLAIPGDLIERCDDAD